MTSAEHDRSAPRPVDVVELAGVHKSFGDVLVLDDIDFRVAQGEVVLLLGPSGSGKSTLLRTINCLERVDRGTVRVAGELIGFSEGARRKHLKEAAVARQRRRTGMVFQSFNLFPTMTALENVASGPRHVLGAAKETAHSEARRLLELVGLGDKCHNYPTQLSGGQQQRVAIARALAMKPSVMLFDEPTSALDPEMVREVLDVMVALRAEGITMIVVSHEMGFARAAADRVVFMSDGKIIADQSPEAFFDDPDNPRIRQFLSKIL
ncbi:amino acid ABC transporter ATP-binding protein [Tsukamurella soli]|uniref:ABC transporter domain-containing protein n=1 Tax=Tsukamurella soli TaxID=644556 RepID=A0ABP8KDX8_9ACTN